MSKARSRADSLRAAIVKGADFGELAKKFSQDPGSGAQGGDLGFFQRERMVKEVGPRLLRLTEELRRRSAPLYS